MLRDETVTHKLFTKRLSSTVHSGLNFDIHAVATGAHSCRIVLQH